MQRKNTQTVFVTMCEVHCFTLAWFCG